MKRILLLFCAVLSGLLLNGQVAIKNNMPAVIDPNTEITVEVRINKGAVVNFARYQMDVPAGIIIKEGDSRGGTFSFEGNRAKIIWSTIPVEAEFSLSIKLVAMSFSGAAPIDQKFYYMDEGARKEINADPFTLTVTGDASKNTTNIGTLPPAQESNTPPKNPDILQAEQLKKDSKDAFQTGLKEKEAADKKSAEADEAIKRAEALQDAELKKAALEKATANKQKAENDKAVASKILVLAKSLDDNANEIERLGKSNPYPNAGNTGDAGTGSGSNSNTSATPATTNGLVYRVQLGAFSQNPEKILYKHMGTIDIVSESGMYKVLMGKFANREDAVKRRDQLVAKSFSDCFIVTYKDGVRVK